MTIKNLQTEIKLLSKTEVKKDDKKIQELEKQQQESEKNIEIIKSFLNKIQYKEIERFYTEYTIQDKEIKELDKKISE